MGRGNSSGGGQSSLGYLFGSSEAPNSASKNGASKNPGPVESNVVAKKSNAVSPPDDATEQIAAGIQGNNANNYFRADGPNCGNFLTDRPSTKVHAAPGGGSSLGYLFGGNNK